MIHAFAIEPKLAAQWGRREAFRFIEGKFGLGTPRVLLELPGFKNWRRAVYDAALELELSELDNIRVAELLQLFGQHRHRRADAGDYEGRLPWIENAELEYTRRPFAGILATQNPRGLDSVLLDDQLGLGNNRWTCATGVSPMRRPQALSLALLPMLTHCRQLHLVDPHFGPENRRYRIMLEALTNVLSNNGITLDVVCVHCSGDASKKPTLAFFESEAASMARRLPQGVEVAFIRWVEKAGGEQLHNRYVLTDVGGVSLGAGLDARTAGTDDVSLLTRAQYELRWSQYVQDNGAFECSDRPQTIVGSRREVLQQR